MNHLEAPEHRTPTAQDKDIADRVLDAIGYPPNGSRQEEYELFLLKAIFNRNMARLAFGVIAFVSIAAGTGAVLAGR